MADPFNTDIPQIPSVRKGWFEHAVRHGHDPQTCNCVGCRRWRGDPVPRHIRKKTARSRGYLWISDDIDMRLRRLAFVAGMQISEYTRLAIIAHVEREEALLTVEAIKEAMDAGGMTDADIAPMPGA